MEIQVAGRYVKTEMILNWKYKNSISHCIRENARERFVFPFVKIDMKWISMGSGIVEFYFLINLRFLRFQFINHKINIIEEKVFRWNLILYLLTLRLHTHSESRKHNFSDKILFKFEHAKVDCCKLRAFFKTILFHSALSNSFRKFLLLLWK